MPKKKTRKKRKKQTLKLLRERRARIKRNKKKRDDAIIAAHRKEYKLSAPSLPSLLSGSPMTAAERRYERTRRREQS